jgi:cardiolipin synthase
MKLILFLFLFIAGPLYSEDEKEPFKDKFLRTYEILNYLAHGSLQSRGLTPGTLLRPNVPSYKKVLKSIEARISSSQCTQLDCVGYQEDLSMIVDSKVSTAQEFELLPNMRAFELRIKLIRQAEKSIHILMWGMEDDETGELFVNELLNALKRRPSLDIKIITDGNISNFIGMKSLKRLKEESLGKIGLIEWKIRPYQGNGTHRKLFITDREHVILGGMNIANYYSHYKGDKKWRDLDIYLKGKSVAEAGEETFKQAWNRQLQEFPSLNKKYSTLKAQASLGEKDDHYSVVLIDQDPGSASSPYTHHIHTSVVKLFRDAKERVDIENAYFILDPILKKELRSLIKRGVKVRIFTNSSETIDEPLISMHVLESAKEAQRMGAQVYLKKNTTLHSKYMIVDGQISMVGSFNFHPRSLHFDAENVAIFFHEEIAKELENHFDQGILDADEIQIPKEIKIKPKFLGLILKYFYFKYL